MLKISIWVHNVNLRSRKILVECSEMLVKSVAFVLLRTVHANSSSANHQCLQVSLASSSGDRS